MMEGFLVVLLVIILIVWFGRQGQYQYHRRKSAKKRAKKCDARVLAVERREHGDVYFIVYEKRKFYSIPGGGRKREENDASTAAREFCEELGLKKEVQRKLENIFNGSRPIIDEPKQSVFMLKIKGYSTSIANKKLLSSRGEIHSVHAPLIEYFRRSTDKNIYDDKKRFINSRDQLGRHVLSALSSKKVLDEADRLLKSNKIKAVKIV